MSPRIVPNRPARRRSRADDRIADPATELFLLCHLTGLPAPERELEFARPRRWRFDLAWPDRKLAVEVDGAVYALGRHTRGAGYEGDLEKLAEALIRGWRVLRVSTGQVEDGRALRWLTALLDQGKEEV